MTKFADLSEKGAYLRLPKIDAQEVRLLWHVNFWDIPLNGVVRYKEQKHWFEICDGQDEEDKYVRYAIVEIMPEQLKVEEYWHNLFRDKVGHHTDFDEHGKRVGVVKPKATHNEFYESYKQSGYKHDFFSNSVLGWFDFDEYFTFVGSTHG